MNSWHCQITLTLMVHIPSKAMSISSFLTSGRLVRIKGGTDSGGFKENEPVASVEYSVSSFFFYYGEVPRL